MKKSGEDARLLLLARAVRRLLYRVTLEATQEERAEFEALLAEVDRLSAPTGESGRRLGCRWVRL